MATSEPMTSYKRREQNREREREKERERESDRGKLQKHDNDKLLKAVLLFQNPSSLDGVM